MSATVRRLSRAARTDPAESRARRLRWAAAGYLPPALAAAFTAAEQAALAVIAAEAGKRGACTLAIGHIAAVAGVCATIVKRALRLARTMGLVTIEERRRARRRNDTNIVRIAGREWAAWLRVRLPRGAFACSGGTLAPSTDVGATRRAPNARASISVAVPRPTSRRALAPEIPEDAGERRSLA